MYEREENPLKVTEADLVVGLASFMEADNIDYPTRQADEGIGKYFGDKSAVIINCDNASPDGTEQVFLGTDTKTPKIYISTPPDTPGKGYNFENMFRKLIELKQWNSALTTLTKCLPPSISDSWLSYQKEAYFLRSEIYKTLKQPMLAIDDLSTILRADPADRPALLARAKLYQDQLQGRLAKDDYEHACILGSAEACEQLP